MSRGPGKIERAIRASDNGQFRLKTRETKPKGGRPKNPIISHLMVRDDCSRATVYRRITKQQIAPPRPDACELCQRHLELVWDHCHRSGLFRGWICAKCNTILG